MTSDRKGPMRVRSHLPFLPENSTFQPDGYWAVVGQRHLHMRPENAACHATMLGASGRDEYVEQTAAQIRRRRAGKAWPESLGGIGGQRELRHQQQLALDRREAQVHFPGRIGENSILQKALEQP